jgi:MraZ protein
MLLTGTYPRTLDDKLRFAIPKPLRDEWEPGTEVVYVGPGTDGSLALYTPAVFAQRAQQMGETPAVGADVRAFQRLYYAQAQRLELDGLGRVRLPTELARWASLDKEIVVLGVREHVEIWDRPKWESYLKAQRERYNEVADAALTPPPSPKPISHQPPAHDQ